MGKKFSKRTEKIVDDMCLMDDDLMSRVFDQNIPATKLLISTILQSDVDIIWSKGQWDIKNALGKGRNIRIDIFAKDCEGKYFDCEVKGDDEGATTRRARFHSSMLDTRMLDAGQEFKELKDSYVIFITKNDYFKGNEPLYWFERRLKSGRKLDDGSHIIYVNGQYNNDDALGHLMSDMRNKKTEGFYYKELEEGVRHHKVDQKGRYEMCESVKEYGMDRYNSGRKKGKEEGRQEGLEEGRQEERTSSIRSLMKNLKITAEEAMEKLDIPKSERKKYMAML